MNGQSWLCIAGTFVWLGICACAQGGTIADPPEETPTPMMMPGPVVPGPIMPAPTMPSPGVPEPVMPAPMMPAPAVPTPDMMPSPEMMPQTCTTPAECNDNNPCTDDICAGICQNPNNTNLCDDGLFCNGADTCLNGACVGGGESPCGVDGACDEDVDMCVECVVHEDCAPPIEDEWGECGGFTGVCSEEGTQQRSVTRSRCMQNSCFVIIEDETQPCTGDRDGTGCGGGICQDGACMVGGPPQTVTMSTSGSGNAAARGIVTCAANGLACILEGNRPEGETNCNVSCPVGSRLEVCCSNGGACSGGSPNPNPTRRIGSFTVAGTPTHDCPTTTATDEIQCTLTVANGPIMIDCSFTN